MQNSRTIEIEGAGPVLFECSRRARRISISIRPVTGVRVAVPYRSSFKEAETFAEAKSEWIRTHLEKMRRYELECCSASPDNDIDKDEAKAILGKRLNQLAEKHGFTYNRLTVRNQKTRWGSCSIKNDISLNVKILKLPLDLRDHILLHELVHTRRKNHGKAFWSEMERVAGNARKTAARMKKYWIELV